MSKALVVDDSRAMRMVLSRTLAQLGIQVEQAGNGQEALQFMERDGASLDFALVDWNMPEMTGIQFVEQVRARPAFRSVRLVMVTTETEISQMARALEAGADEYVMKPFTRDVIEGKLRLLGVLS